MKTKFLILLLVLLRLICGYEPVMGQACQNPSCLTDTLNVSTGYNPNTNSYLSPLAIDANWKLVSVPSNAAVTLPAPSWVIPPHMAWGSFPNAKWISPFQSSFYGTNNPPTSSFGAFRFERCFCLCQSTQVRIKYRLMSDDQVRAYVDNIQLANGTAPNSAHYTLASEILIDTTITLSAGTHCLNIDLYNVGGTAMGFSVEGYVAGANMLKTVCCDPTGRICGTKFHDSDCDGNVSANTDLGLAGWQIILYDQLGNVIASTFTDAQGNYCFSNLPAGNYTVAEVNKPGWTQTFPASGNQAVSIGNNEGGIASFGNCMEKVNNCGYDLSYSIRIHKCKMQVDPMLSGLPPGAQIVATSWTFGDGSSSEEYMPTHYYTSAGTYQVCLSLTIYVGDECCISTICTEVTITDPCDNGCFFDATPYGFYNEVECKFYGFANVQASGYPITNILWEFGDGTSSYETNPVHHYTNPGTYVYCVHLFATDPNNGNCCHEEFCDTVVVICDPCNGGPAGGNKVAPNKNDVLLKQNHKPNPAVKPLQGIDKQAVVLNQNAPNPFAEHTTVTYNIPEKFSKAQLVFSTADGTVMKTFDIQKTGEGILHVYADDLSSGIYHYTLLIDGKIMASKSMIKQ